MPDIEPLKIAELTNLIRKGSQLIIPEIQLCQISKSGHPVNIVDDVSAQLQPI